MNSESIALFFCQGTSDKVYQVQLKPSGDGWIVNYQNGPRGGTMRSGTKTAVPLPYEKAKKEYDKIVRSKLSEGYTEKEGDTPYAGTDKAGETTGLIPQRPTAIDEARLQEVLNDDDWVLEEKMDGEHRMIRKADGKIIGSNLKGLVVDLPQSIVDAVALLADNEGRIYESWVLDGEQIGDVYHAHDLLELDGVDLRPEGAWQRYLKLELDVLSDDSDHLKLVSATELSPFKAEEFERIRARGGEGGVFKLKSAPYTPGKPASGGTMLKFKFKGSATVKVLKRNQGKRSVQIGVAVGSVEPDETTPIVVVGNVTIPPNAEIPVEGQLIEVEYLYAFLNGGSLFQPVWKGLRPDKTLPDAYGTLKFKGVGTDEEES